jgi:cyclic beta-1,2-glucan synthetase
MIRQIELHYLSNPDPQLQFALLTDDVDTTESQGISEARSLLELGSREIAALNAKHGNDGHGPFHLLHRTPRWNPAEERFMGWERKRGKLEELNRLLRGDARTSYARHIGDPAGLSESGSSSRSIATRSFRWEARIDWWASWPTR